MTKKIWDLYAPIYKTAMKADKKIYNTMYRRISKVVKDKEVLEIATGPGLIAKNVAHAAKKMVATDYSEGMIKEARKGDNPYDIVFEVADAHDLQYDDDSFDVVIISNALHVVSEPEKVLEEIHRVLRKNGILIAPNFINHSTGFISKVWSNILKIAGIKFEHQWSSEEYEAFLKENGFEIKNSKVMGARISLDYVECVSKD